MAATRMLATLLVLFALGVAPAHADTVVDLTPPLTGDTSIRPGPDETRTTGSEETTPVPEMKAKRESGGSGSSETYEPPTLQTRHFGFQVELSCKVSGQPGSLELVNLSSEPLPPGTRVKWQFRKDRLAGFFAITGPWGAGRRLVAEGILGDSEPKGDCIARVI